MRKLFAVLVLAGLAMGASSVSAARAACTICTVKTIDLGWFGTWSYETDCHEVPSCTNPF